MSVHARVRIWVVCVLLALVWLVADSQWPGTYIFAAPPESGAQAPLSQTGGSVPITFNYQGVLRLPDGSLANGTFKMTVSIYDAAEGGNQKHSETVENVVVRDGLFTVLLGDTKQMPADVFAAAPRFVGIAVNDGPEMLPRQRIHPVPWAVQANTLVPGATIPGISGTLLVSGPQSNGGMFRVQNSNPGNHEASIGYIQGSDADLNDYWVAGVGAWDLTDSFVLGRAGPKLVITRNGDTGIGTTNPAFRLHVMGDRIRLENAGKVLELRADGSAVDIQSMTSDIYFRTRNNIYFLPWDDPGKVGIGTLDVPARLTIRGKPTVRNDEHQIITRGVDPLEVQTAAGEPGLIVNENGVVSIKEFSVNPTTSHLCFYPGGGLWTLTNCKSAAEYVPSRDNGQGYPQAGDLVSILPSESNSYGDKHAPFMVTKSAVANDPNLIGFIVDPKLGADGEKLDDNYLPLGVYGYFPVKVTMENGPIMRGDAITSSSTPGYGMKATKPGRIVGYALEDANAEGLIQVMARPGDYLADAPTRLEALEKEVQTLRAQNATLQTQLDALGQRLSALEKMQKQ